MKLPEFQNRDWLPDILKGWAVIWMILVHSVELFLSPAFESRPIARFAYFMGSVPAAPVFMFMMGYFVVKQASTTKKSLLRGLQLLLWGLLLNIGLNLSLIIRWLTHSIEVPVLRYIFGVDILLFAGLALIVFGLLKILRLPWYAWLLLALAIPSFNYLIHPDPSAFDGISKIGPGTYLTAFLYGTAPWSYFPLIPWLSYVFAGAGFSVLLTRYPQWVDRSKYHLFTLIPALIIFLAGLGKAWGISSDLPAYYHHETLFFLWALSFIFLLALLLKGTLIWKESLMMQWIRFLGVRVTNVYVVQWIIIGNLGTWLYKSLNPGLTFILFLSVLSVSTGIVLSYQKLRTK
jgi:hypothetical protein